MRSIFLVIISSLTLLAAFMVYARYEARGMHSVDGSIIEPPHAAPTTQKLPPGFLRPGNRPSTEIFDDKTGELKSRFRADEYTPQDDGTVLLTHPVAEFFMPNHQVMKLVGVTGDVEMPHGNSMVGAGAPNRGRIHTCRIELYNLFPDSVPHVPDETIWVNNIQFDNETMLITTESFQEKDKVIPADQVPVKMRGKKYDFDGRGLKLHWNDKDGRLELLEVAHGEQLIVKDSSMMSATLGGTPGTRATKTPPPVSAAPAGPLPVQLAEAGQTAAVSAAAVQPAVAPAAQINPPSKPAVKSRPPSPPVPYVAYFHDNVRITQGADVQVAGDQMAVDFTMKKEQSAPTTQPSSAAGAAGVSAPTAPHNSPQSAKAQTETAAESATVADAGKSPKSPATQPATEPVIIRWTGLLRMVPAKADRPKLLPGDSIVDLTGRPVKIRRTVSGQPEGDDIRAARVIYHTTDGSAKLINSEQSPLVMISKIVKGQVDPSTTITTSTLDYATDVNGRRFAVLTGPGHASAPVQQTQNSKPVPGHKAVDERLDAHWSRGAKAYFVGRGQDAQTIEHVDLAGDVDVKHPQLALQSQALSLFFRPPPKSAIPAAAQKQNPQPELHEVIASEAVHCELAGQNGKKQKIDCNNLDMTTAHSADGKLFARQVDARGAVHAYDQEQDLRSNAMFVTLRPATPLPASASHAKTKPADQDSENAAVELEKMIATGNVQVVNKEGSQATGSKLTVTNDGGESHVRLEGAPLLASVVDAKKNVVTGPVITVDPKEGIARVFGAGNMHVLQDPGDGTKPRPMDVAWIDRADMYGSENRVDVLGDVIVKTIDAEGAVNTATGDRVHIDLAPKAAAATRPATRPAKASDAPADSIKMDVMKDKDVKRITILGNKAKVRSTLSGPNGNAVRQFVILAPKIIYQLMDSEELAAKTVWVPSAGEMFLGDHRPPEHPKPGEKADDESNSRGDTAFQWKRQLVYNEAKHNAVMTGDVVIVHQPEGKESAEGPVRINADQVTAWFDPQPRAPKATTAPATRPSAAGPDSAMQLKRLTAVGNITITRNGSTLTGDQVEFDPKTHWMTAHGTDDRPAHFENADPTKTINARDLSWNTQTWNVKAVGSRLDNPR